MKLMVGVLLAAFPLLAQDPPPDPPPQPHTMVIEVGSRSPERSRTDTPVPVDVVPIAEVADEAGQLDVTQLLQFTAPSFNSNRQSGSDGSDHIDAATLRGLGPDQVLVLINGKRRHSSSLVYIFGTRGRGAVGTDLNTIPVSAIERIEILRDGASAQYGSDAIAGVINIVLKKEAGLDVLLAAGAYTAGDGQNEQIAFNYGLPIGARGTLNLTAELLNRDRTNRAAPGEPRIIGDAQTENVTFFYNLDTPVGANGAFYGHGGYNARDGVAGAWYRGGIGSDDIPSRNSERMYPGGFVPDIGSDIRDLSGAFGYRTVIGGWSADLSTTYGSNRMEYVISRTLNASMATLNNGLSPTEFDAGGFDFGQQTTNLDFSRYYKDWLRGVSVAAGLEHRRETYEIFAGEDGSWRDFDGPGGGNAGSQGFPGFQPVDEVDESRTSKAAYVDLELRTSERLLLTGAIRGEDYSDFGSTVNGKVSFAFAAMPRLNLRGSASSGFRAPSLHQRYFSSTFTDFIAGEAADVKLARNDSELAELVGIPALKEEESMNYSLGFTWNPRTRTALTFDLYQIDIDDRIVLTGGFTADDADIGQIIAEQNLAEARFFTNAIDTQTRGLDVSLSNSRDWNGGQLATAIGLNLNETEVQRINVAPSLTGKEDVYFSTRERMFVEGSAPKTKGTASADYRRARWSGGVRVSYFGEVESGTWTQLDDPTAPPQHYDARFTTDLHLGLELPRNLRLTVGGTNIFDVQPTAQDPNETENGAQWENVQMGFNGAAYFVRLGWRM
ncbi:MAG TPA: TonB-dependent receptor [Thermoanaerobaculia bacterium]|jgi:iron complex outermembrane receptor protein